MFNSLFRKIVILVSVIALLSLSACQNSNVMFNINFFSKKALGNNVVFAENNKNEDRLNMRFHEYIEDKPNLKSGELLSLLPKENVVVHFPVDDFKQTQEAMTYSIQNDYEYIINNVFDVAYSLVGYGGSCLYIASLFVNRYFGVGHSIANIYQVYDPKPGDVMYYANGGLGVEHWAIYLDENHSLQGNYNGSAVILNSIYLNNASYPIFYRVY